MEFLAQIVTTFALLQGAWSLNCFQQASTVCTNWACVDTVSGITGAACTGSEICNTIYGYTTGSPQDAYEVTTQCATSSTNGYSCTFSSAFDATCNNYCSTTDCNNVYTQVTGSTTAKACVQCTGEDTSSCYSSPPTATTCPLATHQYCTTLHTVTLGSNGAKTHDVVFRGCSATDFDDGCQANAMQVDGNSATRETSVTCSKTCTTAGCNNEALPMTNLKGSGVVCKQCLSSHGACASYSDATCLAGQTYCYAKVIYTDGDYYHSTRDVDTFGYEVQIVYEERGCAASPVTGSCTTVTSDVAGSNLNVISCDETCQGDRCNDAWPNRPRCSQCEGRYWDEATGTTLIASTANNYFDHCKNTPPAPKQCPDPSYQYCYVSQKYIADGDNNVKWGYSSVFNRGCLKERAASKCYDYKWRDDREAHFCQFVCDKDDCNLGSDATKVSAYVRGVVFLTMGSSLLKHILSQ